MIGEWLNENTITGIASHTVCRNAEPDGNCAALSRMPPVQCGTRYRPSKPRATMNG
ncbi:hypothetical protein D3C79_1037690 [compost metagenome]